MMALPVISERLYRCLASTIINSTPDARVGCQPYDLLDHIREVFNFPIPLHREIVEEESQNKPEYELHIQSLEARDVNLSPCCKPYCILNVNKKEESFKIVTPPGSPRGRRKVTSTSCTPPVATVVENIISAGDQFTSCLLDFQQDSAHWKEEFYFSLGSDRRQFLKVYLLKTDYNDNSLKIPNWGSANNLNRSPPTSYLKHVFQAFSSKNNANNVSREATEELIGVSVLSLKQLPVNQWCEKLISFAKRRSGWELHGGWQSGALRMKLRLSTKHRSMPNDLPEADCFVSLDELTEIVRLFHVRNASRQAVSYDTCATYSGELPDRSDIVLEQFITANHFPRLTKNILNLGVLLDWKVKGGSLPLNEKTLFVALEYLRNNIVSTPNPALLNQHQKMFSFSLSNLQNEMNNYLYEKCSMFLEHYLQNLPNRLMFFPPSGDGGLLTFKKSLNKFCWDLCTLELWEWTEGRPLDTLKRQIKLFIEEDTKTWFATNCGNIGSGSPATALQEAENLADVIGKLYDSFRYHLNSATTFFNFFEVDYLSETFPIIDSHITASLEGLVTCFRRYHYKLYRDINSMQYGSKITSKLYFAIKNLWELMSSYCDCSGTVISNYQQWFGQSIHLWLHTSKSLSMAYVLKAVKNDKELEKAADDVNFTASVVHALSICKEICSDFMKLQLTDPDVLSLSVVKLADIVCDNIIGYARYLYRYVLGRVNATSKVQLMRAANSIAHIGLYTCQNLPNFLAFETLFECLKTKRGDDSQDYLQIKYTLHKLIASMTAVTETLASDLLDSVIKHLRPEIERHCKVLTSKREEKSGNFTAYMKQIFVDDHVGTMINFLEKALYGFRGILLPELFICAYQKLWKITVQTIKDGIQRGQPPLYYEEIYNYLKELERFFDSYDTPRKDSQEFLKFMQHVELQSRSTFDLILNYFTCLADCENVETSANTNRGMLRVKLGQQHLSGEKINVLVRIVKAYDLAPMDADNSSDPYVIVELCPKVFFPRSEYPSKQTEIKYSSLNPEFKEIFEFTVPQNLPLGTVLGFTVYDYDVAVSPDMEGQAFVHIGSIPFLKWNQQVDDLPHIDLSLRLLTEPRCPSFQILKERRSWDKAAKEFINEQMLLIYYKNVFSMASEESPPDCTTGLHEHLKEIVLKGHNRLKNVFSATAL